MFRYVFSFAKWCVWFHVYAVSDLFTHGESQRIQHQIPDYHCCVSFVLLDWIHLFQDKSSVGWCLGQLISCQLLKKDFTRWVYSTQEVAFNTLSAVPPDWKLRKEPIHVDVAVVPQFRCEFLREDAMGAGRDVAQGILYRHLKPEPQVGNHEMFVAHYGRKLKIT